jgi:hypothetical protein
MKGKMMLMQQIFGKFDANDWEKLGELVKCWVGKKAHPKTLDEFRNALEGKGIDLTKIDFGPMTTIRFILLPYSDKELVVMLPDPDSLKDADDFLKGCTGGSYPLPSFYTMAFAMKPQVGFDDEQMKTFFRQRIGEYSVGNCA